ncbi:MAG: DUF4834 family protein [Bacteroidota bacterium]
MLKILAIFILIYLIVRLFAVVIFPRIVKWYVRRIQRQFYNAQSGHREQRQSQKQSKGSSKVRITYKKGAGKSSAASEKVGEYVDYEEVKEENTSEKNPKK